MPKENRYFSAFVNGVDSDTWYCEYFNMYDKIYVGMIKDMYDSIKRYYPEMDIKCTADTIKFHLSEK